MKPGQPLTPKEFADEVFGGKLAPRWVRARCKDFVRTKGKCGIAVVLASRPYLIPASEVERFRQPLVFARSVRVA